MLAATLLLAFIAVFGGRIASWTRHKNTPTPVWGGER